MRIMSRWRLTVKNRARPRWFLSAVTVAVGLLIAAGFLLMGLVGVPEFRRSFAASLALGGLLGPALWRLHR